MTEFLVVGEALVDVVTAATGPAGEHPGGSPANVAVALARLGRETQLLTRIGDDGRGELLQRHLRSAGVQLVPGSVTSGPTSTAAARLDPAGVARYEIDVDWRLPTIPVPSGLRCLHTGSLATVLQPGADAVQDLVRSLAGRVTVSFDPNIRPGLMGPPAVARRQVERLVGLADVVKASDEDLAWLAGGEKCVEVATAWLALGPAVVVVTRGGSGAVAVSRSGCVEVPAVPVEVVDTVGAGDSFMAGLLEHLARRNLLGARSRDALREIPMRDVGEMLDRASRVAALTCGRAGANPPTAAELGAGS